MSIGLLVLAITAGGTDKKSALAYPSISDTASTLQLSISYSVDVPALDPAPQTEPLPVFVGGEFIVAGIATHYGEHYNGSTMGCGGVYSSVDPAILAVGPDHYAEWPCGTAFEVCGALACMTVTRTDSCPGCHYSVFDLSEAGIGHVCGEGTSTCDITLQPGVIVWPSEAPQQGDQQAQHY